MTEVMRFLLTSKFCPLGLSAPDLQLYTFIKSWKSQRLKRFFLNLQQMTIVIRPSCWHQNFGPNGLSAPAQGLCLNIFSSITADFNISSALRWAIQDQWSSGFHVVLFVHWKYLSLLICFWMKSLCLYADIWPENYICKIQWWALWVKSNDISGDCNYYFISVN